MPATLPNRTPSSGSGLEGLANIAGLLQTLGIGGAPSETTTNSISPEGLNALMLQIIEGNQGLATITSAQNISGGYDSTTNTLLTNDLLSRAAGEVAARNSTTKKTSSAGGAAGLIGGILAVPQIFGAGKDIYGAISGILGGSAASGAGATAAAGIPSGATLNSLFAGGAAPTSAGLGAGLGVTLGGAAATGGALLFGEELLSDVFSGDASVRDILNDTGIGVLGNLGYDLFTDPGAALGNLAENVGDLLDPVEDLAGGIVKGTKKILKKIF